MIGYSLISQVIHWDFNRKLQKYNLLLNLALSTWIDMDNLWNLLSLVIIYQAFLRLAHRPQVAFPFFD